MLQTQLVANNPKTKVTVLGQFVTVAGYFLDLKNPCNATFSAITNELDGIEDDLQCKFLEFIGGDVHKSKKCFEHETEYGKALYSHDKDVKQLAVLNGVTTDEVENLETEEGCLF